MGMNGSPYHARLVRCPHCRHRVEWVDLRESNFGSPLTRCPNCQETVYNKYRKELALVLYEDKGGTVRFSFLAVAVMFHCIMLIFYDSWCRGELERDMLSCVIVFGLIALLMDFWMARIVYRRRHKDAVHRKNMDCLEGRAGEQSKELKESLRRMSRKKYLDELECFGVDIPEYFYHRIGVKEKKKDSLHE